MHCRWRSGSADVIVHSDGSDNGGVLPGQYVSVPVLVPRVDGEIAGITVPWNASSVV